MFNWNSSFKLKISQILNMKIKTKKLSKWEIVNCFFVTILTIFNRNRVPIQKQSSLHLCLFLNVANSRYKILVLIEFLCMHLHIRMWIAIVWWMIIPIVIFSVNFNSIFKYGDDGDCGVHWHIADYDLIHYLDHKN